MSSLPLRSDVLADALPDRVAADARALPGGHRLDAYQLQGVVAACGTSVTYLATDLHLGVSVLLVEYFPVALAWRDAAGQVAPAEPRHVSAYQRGLLAFVDEARALARCDHPSLDRVLRLWQSDGTAYRVMPQHLAGRSLLDVRRDMAGPPDEAALQSLMDGLLGALDAFHRAGHVHGGLHPGHILLLDDDRPLLLGPDWAGRKLAAEFAGTPPIDDNQPGFAPWEQLAAPLKPLPGPWVDLYALSEVVRFCISGELPPPVSARRLGAAGEPSAALVRRLFGEALHWRYGTRLLSTLDAATSGRPQERPANVAQFREWLANGPPYPERTDPAEAGAGIDLLEPGEEGVPPAGLGAREDAAGLRGHGYGNSGWAADDLAPDALHATLPAAGARSRPMSMPSRQRTPAEEEANAFLTPDFFKRLARADAEGEADAPIGAPEPAPAAHRVPRSAPAMPPLAEADTQPNTQPHDRFDSMFSDWSPLDPPPTVPTPPAAPRRPAWRALATLGLVALAAFGAWQFAGPVLQRPDSDSASARVGRGVPTDEAPTVQDAEASLQRADQALARATPTPTPTPAPPATSNAAAAAFALPTEPTGAGPSSARAPGAADDAKASAPTAQGLSDNPRRTASAEAPRTACGTRTLFSLYRCMQAQCAQRRWQAHPQCERLRATDEVD